MILNDQQIVREFVKSRKLRFAIEKLLQKAKGTLESSYSFEDMAFVVSKTDDNLTPEEKSLLLINANLVSTSTSFDDVLFPQTISVESLIETADKSVIASSNQFSEIWTNLTAMIQSLTAINTVALVNTENLMRLNKQAIIDRAGLSSPEYSVMSLSSLPAELSIKQYGDNYLDALGAYNEYARARISRSTVKTINAVEELINNGLSDFSKSSIRKTEQTIETQKEQIASVVAIAKEEIKISADGLVTTVITSDSNVSSADNQNVKPVVSSQLAPRIPIDDHTLSMTGKQLTLNINLIKLSMQSCELMLNPELSKAVDNFSEVTQKLLIGLPSASRTKEAIKSYCDMFVQGINTANEEVAFMLKAAQFVICYNELIHDVIKHVCPSTQVKVI